MTVRRLISLAGIFVFALMGSLAVFAEQSTTQPADKVKPVKLTQPWSRLSSLTDEQKAQIHAIHQAANAQVKAIREKEEADILAILTEEQKAELEQIEQQRKAEQKARQAEKKAEQAELQNQD